jgi:hypothetical protein
MGGSGWRGGLLAAAAKPGKHTGGAGIFLTPESAAHLLWPDPHGNKRGPVSQSSRREPEQPEGQTTFETANLRPETTNLPFVVWVSQRAGAWHDVRVQVAHSVKVIASQMGVWSVRPFAHVEGPGLDPAEEKLSRDWIQKNQVVLVDFWNADIEYTEDLIEKIQAI